MEMGRVDKLLQFLRNEDKKLADEFNLPEVLRAIQEVKVEDKDLFYNQFARAAVLMALGVNHKNLDFAKDEFYDRIDRFCRRAVKVATIIKKNNG